MDYVPEMNVESQYFVSTQKGERLRVSKNVRRFCSDDAEEINFEAIPHDGVSIKNCPNVSFTGEKLRLESLRLSRTFGCLIPQGSVFLRTLKLRGCGLTGNIDFGRLRIWYLDVRDNSLTRIDVSGCERLTKLALSPTIVEKVIRIREEGENEGTVTELKCEISATYVRVPKVTVLVHPNPRGVLKIKMTEVL